MSDVVLYDAIPDEQELIIFAVPTSPGEAYKVADPLIRSVV